MAGRLRVACLALTLVAGLAVRAPLAAQYSGVGGVLLQGIADGEFWSTDANSPLLTRNAGRPAGLGRLQLWGAYEPLPGLVAYAQGEFESGSARAATDEETAHADQFGLRYTARPLLVIDAGRFLPVVGTFAARNFSTRNPLIGVPDGYSLEYPLGVKASGEGTHFDYRMALVSLPTSHEYYVPDPTPRLRPAVGAGVTPFVGFRLGGSFTEGPYLNDSFTPAQLGGQSWAHYEQRVVAADLAFSRGYLETHAEAARGAYDVPGRSAIMGYTYYGEVKYTFTPRFFLATRVERNKYPFIHASATAWTAHLTDFVDGELGAGYRLGATTVVKASMRRDRRWPASASTVTSGYAFAMQLSQAFDAMDWIEHQP